MLAPVFDDTIPGSLSGTEMFIDILEKSGLPVGEFRVTREQAQKNLQAKQLAAGMGMQPTPGGPAPVPQQGIAAPPPIDPTGMPSASALPPIPVATPPPPGNNLPA